MNTDRHQVDCGYWYETENGIRYEGDTTFNGTCYKNLEAWRSGTGVIYISEYNLWEQNDDSSCLWTRETWLAYVRNRIRNDYSDCSFVDEMVADDKFIEGLAEDCLDNSDWQDLSTTFDDFDYNGDWVLDCWEEWQHK